MKCSLLVLALSVATVCFSQTKRKKGGTKSLVPTSNISSISKNVANNLSGSSLSDTDISKGLKEALTMGAKNASSLLASLDGFNKNSLIRIPFPPEVSQVADKLRNLGMGKKVDEFELTLNRAAEQASKDAAPIFANAISQMTINDAKNILTGPNNAATSYLQSKTSDALFAAFSPTIRQALGNTLATSKWTEITTLYNRLPMVSPVETDLTKYTTNRALSGLFSTLASEEIKIRQNPALRTTELLQKVFGSVGK
ncbi:MAG TPA: DUF4197 domain-containing protein [Cytophagales bacterium]|jgi:hypothetical protein|nr:DUF4197 domain-containing protein [Cytophagales bacterium]